MITGSHPSNPFRDRAVDVPVGAGISPARRDFLLRLAGAAALMGGLPLMSAAARGGEADAVPAERDPWQTLAAVYAHMLPGGDGAPAAADIHAVGYLFLALTGPEADAQDARFVVDGVGWLQELAQEDYRRSFAALAEPERERLLRRIETSDAGERWLSLLLTYLLEALLTDPVYGGNTGGVGWRWLEHQPGFPRPPADKRWFRLGRPVRFRRKAL